MCNQTLHHDTKNFGRYCLQYFTTAQTLERHVIDCFKINDKQMIKMSKKMKLVHLKTTRENKNKITIQNFC